MMIHKNYHEFLSSKEPTVEVAGKDPDQVATILFPWQADIVRWAIRRGRAAIFADCGLGKGLPIATPVLTPTGWRAIGDLIAGEQVMAGDGKPYPVTGVFRRGEQAVFRFTFSDNAEIVCDDDHLWCVKSQNDHARNKPWRVMATSDLRTTPLRYGATDRSHVWRIPLTAPANLIGGRESRPLDPYVLGVLLGDGCLSSGTPTWTKNDASIALRVGASLPLGMRVARHDSVGKATCWSITNKTRNGHVENKVATMLRHLGLHGLRSDEKLVPEAYLFAPTPEREALLQGLMDTDGYCGDPTPEFSSASCKLADAVVFLVRSLGGTASLTLKEEPTFTVGEERRTGLPSWRVTMSLPPEVRPFNLPRKADKYHPTSRGLGRWITSIEPVGRAATVCISVASPDQTFVAEHFIVTHNTLMQLEWARQFAGRVLIVAPLGVAEQTIAEGHVLGLDVRRAREVHDLDDGDSGIWITNYERLERFAEPKLDAIVLDESSILKSVDGAIRTLLLERFTAIPHRLCCTATPAPNDVTELANHAAFLGVMSRAEMLATYFVHDSDNRRGTGAGWRLKGHAETAMYRWMARWAVFVRRPSDLGYPDGAFVLPPLEVRDELVNTPDRGPGELFAVSIGGGVGARAKVRRRTLNARVERAAELISASPRSEQWIVWCGLNDEGRELANNLGDDAALVEGSDDEDQKLDREARWRRGEVRVLISKPRIFGLGLNWQHCHNMLFLGIGDSYEQYYQGIRRCWRFGQKSPVDVRIVVSYAEGEIAENVRRKEAVATATAASVIQHMREVQMEEVRGTVRERHEYAMADEVQEGRWRLMLGDCVERISEVETSSVGLSVFSPPFATLYTYSASERDMGNCRDYDEFFLHFGYLIPELLRVTKPARRTCVHVQQVTTTKTTHGVIGWRDFRADVVRAFVAAGWIYDGEVVIDKDPQAQAIRTKSKALMFVQKNKDSTWSRPAMADYVLLFRAPGENPEPVVTDVTNEEWILWARPVWYGIRESNTLQAAEGRDGRDEKHICPLQLETIERCVRLWSNEGDVIFTPFMGIGSECYQALKLGRRAVGIELKPSYFKAAVKNVRCAAAQQILLFDEKKDTTT